MMAIGLFGDFFRSHPETASGVKCLSQIFGLVLFFFHSQSDEPWNARWANTVLKNVFPIVTWVGLPHLLGFHFL